MGKAKCDVLVTCGRFAYHIVRSLGEKGLNVCVIDSTKSSVRFSKYVKGYYLCPVYQEQEEAYILFVCNIIKELQPKVVIPLFDFKIISKNKDRFGSTSIIAVADFAKINLLDDKIELLRLAQSLRIPVVPEINPKTNTYEFPIVAKLSCGRSGDGVFFLNNAQEVEFFYNNHEADPHFFTKYISGTDYCVDCIRWNNDYYYYSVYRSCTKGTLSKGPLREREIVKNEELGYYSRKILDALDYNGICGFDFRVDELDNAFLLESNPRITGGLGAEIAAGFDMPYLLYLKATGAPAPNISIKYGLRTKSFLFSSPKSTTNDKSHKGTINKRAKSVAPIQYDDLFPDDFLYFSYCMIAKIKKELRYWFRSITNHF